MTNTPEVLTACVADNALVLLLATMRRTEFNDKFVRAGNWLKGDALLKLDNVVLQPPVSSGTQWTRAAMGQLVVDNIAAFSRASPC